MTSAWDRRGDAYELRHGSFMLTVTKESSPALGTQWVGRVDGLRSVTAHSASDARRALLVRKP